jgi:hypothetical protein
VAISGWLLPLTASLRDAAHSALSNPYMNEINFHENLIASGRIRKRGLALFAVGSILYVLAVFVMDRLRAGGGAFHYVLLPAWIPLVVACLGFVELVSGAPCYQLKARWAELRAWQCAMIGVFLTVTSVVAIICIAAFLLILLA